MEDIRDESLYIIDSSYQTETTVGWFLVTHNDCGLKPSMRLALTPNKVNILAPTCLHSVTKGKRPCWLPRMWSSRSKRPTRSKVTLLSLGFISSILFSHSKIKYRQSVLSKKFKNPEIKKKDRKKEKRKSDPHRSHKKLQKQWLFIQRLISENWINEDSIYFIF